MKSNLRILILFFLLTIVSSCNNENSVCLKSAGETRSNTENLPQFETIIIHSNLDIKLKQSAAYRITVRGGKNLIPYIDFSVSNSELNIKNKNKCNWLREYSQIEVTIEFPNISEISIIEACDISSIDTLKLSNFSIQNRAGILGLDLNIECDSLWFRSHASTGDYKIKGKSSYSYIYNRGNGFLFARNFKSEIMHLVHRSLGNSEIFASQLLMIELIELGRVYSYGCPDISAHNNDYKQYFTNLGCP